MRTLRHKAEKGFPQTQPRNQELGVLKQDVGLGIQTGPASTGLELVASGFILLVDLKKVKIGEIGLVKGNL